MKGYEPGGLGPEGRPTETPDPEVEAVAELFPRDRAAAMRSVEAAMAAVNGARPARRPGTVPDRIPRWAPALAAAALVAVVSSLLTLAIGRGGDTVMVRFVLAAPEARSVSLAADFTGWDMESVRLSKNPRSGEWEVTIPLKKGQGYFYNFVIDGETWVVDPAAPRALDDGLGGRASYLSL